MIASLGMYDMPLTASDNDIFWNLIRANLGTGPDKLDRETPIWDVWQSPDLLFAQTCSMPFRTRLAGKVTLIGTPDYALPGCPPGFYRSVLITRISGPLNVRDLAGASMAYNKSHSQSGWAAPLLYLAEQGLQPGRVIETGAHAQSARAVVDAQADFAAIDALTWLLLRQSDPSLTARLKIIDETPPTPALPYITANHRDAEPIAKATAQAIKELPPQTRRILQVRQLVHISAETYLALPNP
ncbi:MAG: PhnD/SsuA/transferrin family substrate-binding protein [Paracoccaceae bacterium]